MKRSLRRETVWTLALLAILAVGLLYGALRLQSTLAALDTARQNTQQLRMLETEIESMRGGEQRAALSAASVDEMSARVEAAARDAGVPAAKLVRIDPQPPRRVGETNYRQQTTRVELEHVTLAQLLSMLDTALGEESNWVVPHIRLSAPRDISTSSGAELWNAEMDLTQFIFAPTSAPPRQG